MLGSLGKLKTYLGEITGLASLIIGIAMILANQAPGPWPQTTSVLVVLLSVVFLWRHWWPQIHRKSSLLLVKPRNEHWSDGILDLIRRPAKQVYQLPLRKRRVQSTVLFGLSVTALMLVYPLFGGVIYEINPPDIPEGMELCKGDKSVDALRIVVTDFKEQEETFIEERIVDQLLAQISWGSGMLVCKVDVDNTEDVTKNRIEAQQLGESTQAAIVVWGRSDKTILEINLEIAQWDIPVERIPVYPTPETQSPTFQMREPVLIGFVVEYTLSQLFYVQGDTLNARNRLETAIITVQEMELTNNQDYIENFRDAYFMLGYFYDESPAAQSSSEAIKYYSLAIEVDPEFYPAYINRAIVYDVNNQIDLALSDYNVVIEKAQQIDPESAAKAYINMAWIYVDSEPDHAESLFAEARKLNELDGLVDHGIASLYYWDNPEQAVEDFSTALALNPDNPYIYNHLGKARLLNGQFDEALETYQQAIESATWEDGDFEVVIDQLKQLQANNPDLKIIIGQIIRLLKAARPSRSLFQIISNYLLSIH